MKDIFSAHHRTSVVNCPFAQFVKWRSEVQLTPAGFLSQRSVAESAPLLPKVGKSQRPKDS